MPDLRFADFLAESFTALRREWPAIHAQMCRTLAPREVVLTVDGDVVPVRFNRTAARLLKRPQHPAIEVRTSRSAILALVDAHCTLAESVLSDQLVLTGSPADLLCFHDALMTYLHGAVRAPSFPQLLRRFRQSQPHCRAVQRESHEQESAETQRSDRGRHLRRRDHRADGRTRVGGTRLSGRGV